MESVGVDSIGNESIYGLKPQPIDRAAQEDSKTPLARLDTVITSQDIDDFVNLEDIVQCVCRMK